MKLYRVIGEDDDVFGFASISGPLEDRELEGMRPATTREFIWWYVFRERFSYPDYAAILVGILIVLKAQLPLVPSILASVPVIFVAIVAVYAIKALTRP